MYKSRIFEFYFFRKFEIKNDKNPLKPRNWSQSGRYISIGLETFLPAAFGVLIGHYWIDEKYGTTPLWTLILGLFGFVVSMYKLFKTVSIINAEGKRDKNTKDKKNI